MNPLDSQDDALRSSIRVLVVDDEEPIRVKLAEKLGALGYTCDMARDGAEALDLFHVAPYDIVLADLKMPRVGGMEMLATLARLENPPVVVIVTGFGTVESAVEAMKLGARDFILKPIEFDQVKRVVERSATPILIGRENARLKALNRTLADLAEEKSSLGDLIGRSPKMEAIREQVRALGATDTTVLILGETGTGKEVVARAIHLASQRKQGPFVPIHCGAIPEPLLESDLFGHERGAFTGAHRQKIGRFEQANGGTLFLDEVGDIPSAVQAKLLRALQYRTFEHVGGTASIRVDVRIIAATNRDLREAILAGRFREDLFYRLNVFPIQLPPLRERPEDLPLFIEHFLRIYAGKLGRKMQGLSEDAYATMLRYGWPGNVREVENLIERALIMDQGEIVSRVDIPTASDGLSPSSASSPTDADRWEGTLKEVKHRVSEQVERQYLASLLFRNRGSLQKTAGQAGIDAKTLYDKMRRYGLKKEAFKNPMTNG